MTDDDLDLVAFEAFLRRGAARVENYSESTVRTIMRETKTALKAFSHGAPFAVRPAVKQAMNRVVAFSQQKGVSVPGSFLMAAELFLEQKKHIHAKRKSAPRSMDDESWERFCSWTSKDPAPEARVLEVMQQTGLRIGDILRVRREELTRALKTGKMEIVVKGRDPRTYSIQGARGAWVRLQAAWDTLQPDAENIAAWICPSGEGSWLPGDGAYTRVRTHLKTTCQALGISERVFLHRLRRTVAVLALKASDNNVVAVGKLLGHRSIAATQRYLDEDDAEGVADLQRKIRKGAE